MMLCIAIHRVKSSKVTDKYAWRRNRWCFTVTSPVLSSSALLSSLSSRSQCGAASAGVYAKAAKGDFPISLAMIQFNQSPSYSMLDITIATHALRGDRTLALCLCRSFTVM